MAVGEVVGGEGAGAGTRCTAPVGAACSAPVASLPSSTAPIASAPPPPSADAGVGSEAAAAEPRPVRPRGSSGDPPPLRAPPLPLPPVVEERPADDGSAVAASTAPEAGEEATAGTALRPAPSQSPPLPTARASSVVVGGAVLIESAETRRWWSPTARAPVDRGSSPASWIDDVCLDAATSVDRREWLSLASSLAPPKPGGPCRCANDV